MKKRPQKEKYEVIGTDIETEYKEMDTEDEEHEVRKLTKEELENVSSIQGILHNSSKN